MMFSTSDASGAAAAAEADKGGDGGGGGEEGSKEGAGEGEAAPPQEENPLEGVEADDGDPGPPPPLDPSIVTEPSPKVGLFSLLADAAQACVCRGYLRIVFGPDADVKFAQDFRKGSWFASCLPPPSRTASGVAQ